MRMAAPSRTERRRARAGRSRGSGGETAVLSTLCLAAGLLVAVRPALLLLLLFGLLPTIAAWIAATPGQVQRTRCIGFANLAGALPVAAHLLNMSGHGMLRGLADPLLWAAIYGAAAFGWSIYVTIPAIAESLLRRRLDREARMLEQQQAMLIREWGTELSTDGPQG